MYPEDMVKRCREELTEMGVVDLKTAMDVDQILGEPTGTTLVVVNSVCGCAAGGARPAIGLALDNETVPDKLTTVFAGVNKDATDSARSRMVGYAPSSPAIALFKDGQLVFMMERHDIEGRQPEEIAGDLREAFNSHCKAAKPA